MHHDIGSVKNILPIGDALHIDEVHYTSVDESIEYIAKPSTCDEAEAVVLVALDVFAYVQVSN